MKELAVGGRGRKKKKKICLREKETPTMAAPDEELGWWR
jgi:hypothetical protein